MSVEIFQGDCLQVLRTLPDASVHSVVTDPPYGLEFMGNQWDGNVPDAAVWREALRVAKPGAFLLAFGGTRTFHRMAVAIEDAGWEIRDCIMWVYGSGFPKSLDVSKAIDKAAGAERSTVSTGKPVKRMIPGADQNASGSWIKDSGKEYQPGLSLPTTDNAKRWAGWGTALKPAWEPIIVARKHLEGTNAANVLKHGCGALNIDGCRIPGEKAGGSGEPPYAFRGENHRPFHDTRKRDGEQSANRRYTESGAVNFAATPGPRGGDDRGRYPANLIHDGSDEVIELFPEVASGKPAGIKAGGKKNCFGEFAGGVPVTGFGDAGSAARFFYCAKASGDDREPWNNHPTVKPLALMKYLVRLVTPESATVLDPFLGSGTTAMAARSEGCNCIGIELNPEYVQLAKRRLQQLSLIA